MRVVIQRVSKASVSIDNCLKSAIGTGLLILLGIEDIDNQEDIDFLVGKIINLRIFDDENGVMNRSLTDIGGEVLCISQFTLYASTRKGNRPSYIHAAKSDAAILVYNRFCIAMSLALQKQVKTGEFGANMQIELVNDGPVTILIDSKNRE
jgi:D-tyrosyl-tRNA(Tyr) deacylase